MKAFPWYRRRPWIYSLAIPVTLWRRLRRWLYSVREYNILEYRLDGVSREPGLAPRQTMECLTHLTEPLRQFYRERYHRVYDDVEAAFRAVSRRFLQGDRCFALFHDGHMTTAVWASTCRMMEPELERHRPLQADAVALYDIYALPRFRRKGYYEALFRACVGYYRRQSARMLVMVVDGHNTPSLNANLRVGMRQIVFRMWRLRLLGRRWILTAPSPSDVEAILGCPWSSLRLSWDLLRGRFPAWRTRQIVSAVGEATSEDACQTALLSERRTS